MRGIVVVLFLSFILYTQLAAQVYHYATGKTIPSDEPGLVNSKNGVFQGYPAEYSILLTRENRNIRNSRLISIPVIRIKATHTDSVTYPIFILYGGPGETNLKSDLIVDPLLKNHDVILMGYRGVDGSVQLNCNCMTDALQNDSLNQHNSDFIFGTAIDSCLAQLLKERVDVSAYTIETVAQDIFDLKEAFGYKKVSFLAFSYGTMVAQKFALQYPTSLESLLLIGARPINKMAINGSVLDTQIRHFIEMDIPYTNSLDYYKIKQLLDSIIYTGIYPEIPFNLFVFSQFYTFGKIAEFFKVIGDFSEGKTKPLKKMYNEFYQNYPGKMVVGDMLLKKQHSVVPNTLLTDSLLGVGIAQGVNVWYTPNYPLLQTQTMELFDTVFSPTCFVCGEFDVASPPALLQTIKPYFINSNCIELKNTGHLDLFYDKKPELDSIILNFYK